jgi:hypothetical protein
MVLGTVLFGDVQRAEYCCRIEQELAASDATSGRFVRVALHADGQGTPAGIAAIGVIYTTMLLTLGSGMTGAPAALPAQALFACVVLLGMIEQPVAADLPPHSTHGRPLFSPEPGSPVETMSEEEVLAFHFFSDKAGESAYLHMGYLPLLLARDNRLRLAAALCILDQLERLLFPLHSLLLSLVRHDCTRRLLRAGGLPDNQRGSTRRRKSRGGGP